MSDFPSERAIIQLEQLYTRRPTSESLFQPIAGALNKQQKENYLTKLFVANGSYKSALGRNRFDGFHRFDFNATIFRITLFSGDPGISGTTEADILLFTAPSSIGASILSTTPKVTSVAGADSWISNGETVTGMTAPVLVVPAGVPVNAGDVIEAKLLQVMGGNPKDLQIQVDFLPR